MELASKVTNVGMGAYMGAIKVIPTYPLSITSNTDDSQAIGDDAVLRETLASMLTVEARHDAFLRMGIQRHPFPTTFDTGLTSTWAYNLVQDYIVECAVPFNDIKLPTLKLTSPISGPVAPGTPITFSWNPDTFLINLDTASPLYMAGVAENVTDPIYAEVTKINATHGTVLSPADIPSGVVYVCLTTFNGGLTQQQLTDYGTLAGPLEIVVS